MTHGNRQRFSIKRQRKKPFFSILVISPGSVNLDASVAKLFLKKGFSPLLGPLKPDLIKRPNAKTAAIPVPGSAGDRQWK